MVLESLFPARKILKNPLNMLVLSFVVSFASIFIANWVFPGSVLGAVITLIITVTMTPVVYRIFRIEEEIEREEAEHLIHKSFLERHGETILIFSLFFIGNFLAVFLTAAYFPEDFVARTFSDQLNAIKEITNISGQATTEAIQKEFLEKIIFNNLKVMLLAFALSFLIGTGALIILSWNSSILALYLAHFVRKGLFEEFFSKAVGIAPHAPIEIGAYFLAGIAGGILSVGVIREHIRSKEFMLVFKDSLILLGLSVLAVVLGGYLEVFL